jgi:hypothetical protein
MFNLGRGRAKAAPPGGKPTVDEIRRRLGGRASTEPGAGELITLTTPGGEELPGVVLFAAGDDVDVWVEQPGSSVAVALGSAVVRRARRADLRPLRAPASSNLGDLGAVAGDARVFGALLEGQRIRYPTEQGLTEGILVEKCRFGAVVERSDGSLVGVGFRRILPAQPDGDAS